jgi:ribosomal protein S28E/S33
MKDVTRVEVIDSTGRAYVATNVTVELSVQDEGRTLKVFVKGEKKDVCK